MIKHFQNTLSGPALFHSDMIVGMDKPKCSFLPEKCKDYEFWSLLDPRWPELHNKVYMYFGKRYSCRPRSVWLIKRTLHSSFTQMHVQSSTKGISTHYIRYSSSNRAWPPGVLAGQVGTDAWTKKKKKKNDEKGVFFFSSWAVSIAVIV